MVDRIRLVQGDNLPSVIVQISKDDGSGPLDLRGSTVVMKFRASGAATPKDTLTGVLMVGFDDGSGNINLESPYNLSDGRGGRVQFTWGAASLDTAGSYEGEVEITFTNGQIQTAFDRLKFSVREQF